MSRPQPDMFADPAFVPREYRCACGAEGCFGLAPPIVTVPVWFCPACKPADFYTREAA